MAQRGPDPSSAPQPFVVHPASRHTHSLVLLHGLGSNGEKFDWEPLETGATLDGSTLTQLLSGARFVFPTTRRRRSTAVGRSMLTQWFDMARPAGPGLAQGAAGARPCPVRPGIPTTYGPAYRRSSQHIDNTTCSLKSGKSGTPNWGWGARRVPFLFPGCTTASPRTKDAGHKQFGTAKLREDISKQAIHLQAGLPSRPLPMCEGEGVITTVGPWAKSRLRVRTRTSVLPKKRKHLAELDTADQGS